MTPAPSREAAAEPDLERLIAYHRDTAPYEAYRAETVAALSAYHASREEAEKRRDFMDRKGYRRCDTAACNCGSWHGGNAENRLREIAEIVNEYTSTNGVILADAIHNLGRQRDAMRETLIAALVHQYRKSYKDAAEVATLCDEQLDRSGTLLGDVRKAAALAQPAAGQDAGRE